MKYLTVAEVATTLRVSKMTIYRLVDTDDLASIRVGRTIRIPEKAVERYVAAGGSPETVSTSRT